MSARMPTLYVTHGGGPMPILGDPGSALITKDLKTISQSIPQPKAIVIVTAHWEESSVTVSTVIDHTMYYDYYGFPAESYKIKYPAKGSSEISSKVVSLLSQAGIPTKTDNKRGMDHGVFVPLILMYPKADIPVIPVSILGHFDPRQHIEIGKALSPLRQQGVLIIGSGSSFHNLPALFSAPASDKKKWSEGFHNYLTTAVTTTSEEQRLSMLENWRRAPYALECQPREDHLIPLMVVAGAAGPVSGSVCMNGELLGTLVQSYIFE